MYMEDIKKGKMLIVFLVNVTATVLKFHDKDFAWKYVFGAIFQFSKRVSLESKVKRLKVI